MSYAQNKCAPLSNSKFKGGIQDLNETNFSYMSSLFFSKCFLNEKLYILKLMYICFPFQREIKSAGWFSYSYLVDISPLFK